MPGDIVFCIWLGTKIPSNYVFRINIMMTELYIKNKTLQFILYSDNPNKIKKQFLTYFEELQFLNKKITILDTKVLFDRYDAFVSKIIPIYKTRNDILSELDTMSLRNHHMAYGKLYPAYLYFLYMKKLWHARVSLNLRLIALSMHGGLYFDMDVMSQSYVEFHDFQSCVNTYIGFRDNVYKFLEHSKEGDYNAFVKFCKKTSVRYPSIIGIPIQLSKDKRTKADIEFYLKEELLKRCKKILTDKIYRYLSCVYVLDGVEMQNTIYNEGIYAISNYITKQNPSAGFSQNILYVTGTSAMATIEDGIETSLVYNMKLTTLQPGTWLLRKQSNGNWDIVPNSIISYPYPFPDMPLDIFLTRKTYPYLIQKDTGECTITYRKGRPLHPLGQIATRGCWNFITGKLHKFTYTHILPQDVFHVAIKNTILLPESAVLENNSISVMHVDHWTKVKNSSISIMDL